MDVFWCLEFEIWSFTISATTESRVPTPASGIKNLKKSALGCPWMSPPSCYADPKIVISNLDSAQSATSCRLRPNKWRQHFPKKICSRLRPHFSQVFATFPPIKPDIQITENSRAKVRGARCVKQNSQKKLRLPALPCRAFCAAPNFINDSERR